MTEQALAPPPPGASITRRLPFSLPVAVFVTITLGLLLVTALSDALAQVPPPAFSMRSTPQPLPEIEFENGEGEAMSLADFKGSFVLLNIWATWCAPCRREMPTLDRLQATLGGPDFQVVALSIDRQGLSAVQEFYAELGLQTLPIYVDQSGKAQHALSVLGVPTTLLLDREGKEIGRLLGPAEWDSPEMMAFFREYLKRTAAAEVRGARGPARVTRGSWSHASSTFLPVTGRDHLTRYQEVGR